MKIIDTKFLRLLNLRSDLELEIMGDNKNAYSIIKKEFGFKGDMYEVHSQLSEYIKRRNNRE